MIADCETCDRKQVPCKSCQESQRAICYVCQGDVADPYCELNTQTFRKMDGKPIYWRDKRELVHACEGSEVHRGITLIWTLCQRDVPADAAYKCDGDEVTCVTCAAAAPPSHC